MITGFYRSPGIPATSTMPPFRRERCAGSSPSQAGTPALWFAGAGACEGVCYGLPGTRSRSAPIVMDILLPCLLTMPTVEIERLRPWLRSREGTTRAPG
jgi:hypothetical protein